MTISATTRGLRPGVCTSTTRPGSPFDGQLIYETDTNRVAVYDTSAWVYKTPASTTGSVLQVVSTNKTDTFTTTSTSYVDITGMSASITPQFTTSKILVMVDMKGANSATDGTTRVILFRDSTQIALGDAAGSRSRVFSYSFQSNYTGQIFAIGGNFLDSPNTTSAVTYKLQTASNSGSNTSTINRSGNDTDSSSIGRTISSITLMEIAG